MDLFVLTVFTLTYLGMAAGGLRGWGVDRAWIAVAAGTALLAAGALTVEQAVAQLDIGALILLFALMVLSAQYAVSGVYARAAHWIADHQRAPAALLAATVAVAGVLSALLVNDIVAFALAPVLCRALFARGLDPRPFLIALAAAANAGSAATLIGNPQNILIGQAGALDFWRYSAFALVPALLTLLVVYAVIWWLWRRRWWLGAAQTPDVETPTTPDRPLKPLLATLALLALFATPLPREVSALALAVLLLASRRLSSRELVAQVDWNLLLLFMGLFVVTGVAAETQAAQAAIAALAGIEALTGSASALAGLVLAGSSLIGNVPLTLLFLHAWPDASADTLRALALLSTLAGNALLIGSVVNLIVAERAQACGLRLGFGEFARAGIPITLISMTIACAWLVLGGWLPL